MTQEQSMSEISVPTTAVPAHVVTPVGGGDVLVIAEQPGEMQAAQQALIVWADQKVKRVREELADANAALDSAAACGLRLHGVRKLVKSAEQALEYYEKVKAALELGYCIVPEFPVDIVAIRTSRDSPDYWNRTETTGWKPDMEQSAEVLPEGEGEYVSPLPKVEVAGPRDKTNARGEVVDTLTTWRASEFRDVGLPIKFMKPRVIAATDHAMKAKVFDEIGILPARPKKDPLIVGRIIDQKGRRLSFLISWFVDSRDL